MCVRFVLICFALLFQRNYSKCFLIDANIYLDLVFFCYWFYGVAATLLCISYYSYVRTISALIVLSIITAQTLMNHMEN